MRKYVTVSAPLPKSMAVSALVLEFVNVSGTLMSKSVTVPALVPESITVSALMSESVTGSGTFAQIYDCFGFLNLADSVS